ncbi:DUF1592 domain-containing protein [Verrucomicrobia bacterium]|nr:DUF1592 domain-containing protein [Verrucomicrobiota bacterium]
MRNFLSIAFLALLTTTGNAASHDLFVSDILPALDQYCFKCHNEEKAKGDLNLKPYSSAKQILKDRKTWLKVLEQIETEEMPSKEPLPTPEERKKLVDDLHSLLHDIDWASIRDPGHVTIPRLTRAEYNNTIRDLTGLDSRPGNFFSADGEGESGFTNDRDNLFITPTQMEKYFDAAERAFDAVLALDDPQLKLHMESEDMFMTETRETPQKIGTDFNGYFLNRGQMTLYDSLTISAPGFYKIEIRAAATTAYTAGILRINDELKAEINVPDTIPRVYQTQIFLPAGGHQMAWNIKSFPRKPNQKADKKKTFTVLSKDANEIIDRESTKNAPVIETPSDQTQETRSAYAQVNSASNGIQRPYEWLRLLGVNGSPKEIEKFIGFIEERTPSLDEALKNLAKLSAIPKAKLEKRMQMQNGHKLADNKRILSDAKAALAAAPPLPAGAFAVDWIKVTGPTRPADFPKQHPIFGIAGDDTDDAAAKRVLRQFTERAFRRPTSDKEWQRYFPLYQKARQSGSSFKQALKGPLSAVLVSPSFLYRVETGPTKGRFELTPHALASRLSYFLWTTMPDKELIDLANSGKLTETHVLKAQIQRMVRDRKFNDFTKTFTGQWLGFEALGESVFPDPRKFPQFTASLGQSMKQETYLFFADLFQNNRSLLELIDSQRTFLDRELALHYGIKGVSKQQFKHVILKTASRGGLLGMASVLTATSSPRRTSPVIRGKWVLETLLGTKTPDPPADAGELPGNAGENKARTLREELLHHRRNPTCASCHDKIDPLGFSLENFDPIGRFRKKTEFGNPIDSKGALPNGVTFNGPTELKRYLRTHRKEEFLRNLTERMLSFALGRPLQTYDEAAIRKIVTAVEAADYSASTLVKEIVLSYPFKNQNNSPSEY